MVGLGSSSTPRRERRRLWACESISSSPRPPSMSSPCACCGCAAASVDAWLSAAAPLRRLPLWRFCFLVLSRWWSSSCLWSPFAVACSCARPSPLPRLLLSSRRCFLLAPLDGCLSIARLLLLPLLCGLGPISCLWQHDGAAGLTVLSLALSFAPSLNR